MIFRLGKLEFWTENVCVENMSFDYKIGIETEARRNTAPVLIKKHAPYREISIECLLVKQDESLLSEIKKIIFTQKAQRLIRGDGLFLGYFALNGFSVKAKSFLQKGIATNKTFSIKLIEVKKEKRKRVPTKKDEPAMKSDSQTEKSTEETKQEMEKKP